GLMVLVLFLGGGFGWVVRRTHIQRDAVAAIRRGGGAVVYDWQSPNGQFNKNANPPGPRWLVDALGPDFLGSVKAAQIGPRDADAVMAHIGQLHRLEELSIRPRSTLTNAGMVHLRGLARLKTFGIGDAKITGAGLANLAALTQLRSLNLNGIP